MVVPHMNDVILTGSGNQGMLLEILERYLHTQVADKSQKSIQSSHPKEFYGCPILKYSCPSERQIFKAHCLMGSLCIGGNIKGQRIPK